MEKNNNKKIESVKSLFDSIKKSIMEKVDCDFADCENITIDKNKSANNGGFCFL